MRIPCAALAALSLLSISCSRSPEPVKTAADIATEASSPESMSAMADVPIYPEASLPEKLSNVRTDGKQTRYEIVMLSEDAPAKVSAFYEKELKLSPKQIGAKYELMGTTPKGNLAIINIEKAKDRTKIVAVSVAMK